MRYSDDPTTNEEVLVIYINKNILIAVHHIGISYFLFQQKGHTNEDVLHYAALRTSMTDRPKRQMGAINEECVYGRVKHHR